MRDCAGPRRRASARTCRECPPSRWVLQHVARMTSSPCVILPSVDFARCCGVWLCAGLLCGLLDRQIAFLARTIAPSRVMACGRVWLRMVLLHESCVLSCYECGLWLRWLGNILSCPSHTRAHTHTTHSMQLQLFELSCAPTMLASSPLRVKGESTCHCGFCCLERAAAKYLRTSSTHFTAPRFTCSTPFCACVYDPARRRKEDSSCRITSLSPNVAAAPHTRPDRSIRCRTHVIPHSPLCFALVQHRRQTRAARPQRLGTLIHHPHHHHPKQKSRPFWSDVAGTRCHRSKRTQRHRQLARRRYEWLGA